MKRFFLLLVFIILSISLVTAAYESVQGIEEASFEYENYKSCVDSCASCELNCKERLLEQAAETRQDENFCLQLADEARKTFCLDNIYRSKSVIQKDLSLCDKISLPEEIERCKLNVLITKAIETKDESQCKSLSDSLISICKNSFYQAMAFQEQDKSYCNKLSDVEKQNCLNNLESVIVTETTDAVQTSVSFDYKKIGIYAGIVLGIIFIITIVCLLLKWLKPKAKQEAPLVLQKPNVQKPAAEKPNAGASK